MISITGLNKAAVLAALYNASKQQGMGFLHTRGADPMTIEQAQAEIDMRCGSLFFDYLHGRIIKVDISGDTIDPRLYDRDLGDGACATVVASMRIGYHA